MVFVIIVSSSKLNPNSSKISTSSCVSDKAKIPCIVAFEQPFLTNEAEALLPHNWPIASIMIDLPAPVSPVKTDIESSKSTFNSSIITKEEIYKLLSISNVLL